MSPIKVICAWCRVVLRDGNLPISHGICPTCSAKLAAEAA